MGAITYIAKRLLEPAGFSKSGSDLSVAIADDSINASTTNLSGLLADQWVLPAGFSNAVNNSWMQAKVNSTSGKITGFTPPFTHLRLPGANGNNASTPDAAGNQIVADLTEVVECRLADYTPASIQTLLAKWNATGNLRCYALSVNTDGTLNYSWSTDGTAVISKNSTAASGVADLSLVRFKVTHDVNNGAAGNDVKFWKSIDGGQSWTQIGTTVTTAGTTSIANKATPLEVGSLNGGTGQLAVGRISYATVGAGIDPVPSQVFDASLGIRGSSTFVAATGETWTINTSGSPPAQLQGPVLVTEAAGALVTLTGYKRGYLQTYNLASDFAQGERSVKVIKNRQQPMGGGAPEVLLQRREVTYKLQTDILTEAELPQWREFLASVEGGETFTIDRYGTIASPVEPKQAVLEDDGYEEQRLGGQLYRISFSARIL